MNHFSDHNRNEIQDKGEEGVVGAKVYFDHGAYAVTDTAGQYHFKQIDPGVHAPKYFIRTAEGAQRKTPEKTPTCTNILSIHFFHIKRFKDTFVISKRAPSRNLILFDATI